MMYWRSLQLLRRDFARTKFSVGVGAIALSAHPVRTSARCRPGPDCRRRVIEPCYMTLRFKAKVWIHRKVSLAIQAPERSREEFGHRGDDLGFHCARQNRRCDRDEGRPDYPHRSTG